LSTVFDSWLAADAVRQVLAASTQSAAQLATLQRTRLTSLLDAAVRGSRLYRDSLRGDTATVPLHSLPVVTRDQLMQSFGDWVCDPQVQLSELRAFTADPQRIGEPFLGKYLVWESSGTGGLPGIFLQDAQTMAVFDALELLRRSSEHPMRRWFDPFGLGERIAFVGATGGHFASHVSVQRVRQLNQWMAPSLRSFCIMQGTARLVADLNAYRPTVVATYPTAAALLADEAAAGRLHVSLHEVLTGGETLSPAVRQHIEHTLRCGVRNSYGASEFLPIGWQCSHGHMHVNADWVILEPVDERFRPVPAGEQPCTTLLTNLANHSQPLIRYDLGDQVTFSPEPCTCGSALPVIDVQGRRDDPLVMAGAQGDTVTLLPLALTTVLEDDAGVFDFQLRQQDARTLELTLPLEGQACADAMQRCRTALDEFAEAQGLAPIQLIEQSGQPVPRGRSGKAQRVIRLQT
jgi:phenylacetate-CoA ligase